MGIIFSLLAPLISAFNNLIDKFLLEKYSIKPTVIAIYSGLFAFVSGLIILLFAGLYTSDLKTICIIIASGFLTELYLLPYYKALSIDEASRVIPLFQFVPIFILLLSFFLLGERMLLKQYIGSLLIILSGFLLTIKKPEKKLFRIRPALWFMILSSFMFALSIIFYKLGIKNISFWQTLPYEGLGILFGVFLVLLYGNNYVILKKASRKFSSKVYVALIINEIVYIGARYTGYFALFFVSASVMGVLGGLQPAFVLLLAIALSLFLPRVLKEVISPKVLMLKFISIISIIIGLYLIFF